ncbi:hypothetical protein [Brevundimonas sp.]
MEEPSPTEPTNTFWLVLPPSVDRQRWLTNIHLAAYDAGWRIVQEGEAAGIDPGPQRLVITDDAHRATLLRAERIAAIVAEPESAPDAVIEAHGISTAEAIWHASMLLARALALAPDHEVVTARDLVAKPAELMLLGGLKIVVPESQAEFPKDPILAAAFRVYRDVAANQDDVFEWSERLFTYCPKASRDMGTSGVLDTTGRPRMLVHGPYLSLPPGLWRATMRFGVDRDAARHRYRLDWGTRTETISEHVIPGAPGMYELTLDFEWVASDAAEVRLILMEGSFMGSALFQGMTLRRITPDQASEDRAAA